MIQDWYEVERPRNPDLCKCCDTYIAQNNGDYCARCLRGHDHSATDCAATRLARKHKEEGRKEAQDALTGKYVYDYPRHTITVDIVCFRQAGSGEQVLLIKRGNNPFKDCWALPGGFVDPGETTMKAAKRELLEETGLKPGSPFHLVGVFDDPDRDPRGPTISIAYMSPHQKDGELKAGDDAAEAQWFDYMDLPMDMAFDHAKILDRAYELYLEYVEYSY